MKFDPGIRETWIGSDFGYTNDTACVILQMPSPLELRVVVEAHWNECSEAELLDNFKSLRARYGGMNEFYGDAANASIFKGLREQGFEAHKVPFGIYKQSGIEQIRLWMQAKAGRKMRINERLKYLIDQLIGWHYKADDPEEKIVKKDDHGCDALVAALRHLTRGGGPSWKTAD